MKKDTLRITDPAFNEYLYSVLYNASYEECEKLPRQYHKLIKSENAAKRFIKSSGWDEKMMVLSYLGANSFYVIDEKSISMPSLKKIVAEYKEKQKGLTLNEIVQSGLYITSNKHLISVLTLTSQTIQGNTYKYNMEYKRIGYSIKRWMKALSKGEFEENMELDKFITKTLHNNNSIFRSCRSVFNIRENEMQILLYLHMHTNSYIPIEKIWEDNAGMLTKAEVSHCVKSLFEADYIGQHPIKTHRKYCIESKGIRTISDYKHMIAKHNNFN